MIGKNRELECLFFFLKKKLFNAIDFKITDEIFSRHLYKLIQLTCKMFFLDRYTKAFDEYQTIKLYTVARVLYVARYLIIYALSMYYVIIALKINEIFTRGNENKKRNDAFSCHFLIVFAS